MAQPDIVRLVASAILKILEDAVDFPVIAAPPDELPNYSSPTLLVYLYRVEECAMKNVGPLTVAPTPPTLGPAVSSRDPMSINLYLLLIPTAPTTPPDSFLDTYVILGQAMQALYDNGSFTLGEWVDVLHLHPGDKDLQFRISLNPLPPHDLFDLWQATQQPYRLSVAYAVRTAHIDSDLTTSAPLVSERSVHASALAAAAKRRAALPPTVGITSPSTIDITAGNTLSASGTCTDSESVELWRRVNAGAWGSMGADVNVGDGTWAVSNPVADADIGTFEIKAVATGPGGTAESPIVSGICRAFSLGQLVAAGPSVEAFDVLLDARQQAPATTTKGLLHATSRGNLPA